MFAKPQAEHAWLDQLVGQWTVETQCQMDPDQPPQNSVSELNIRSLEGMWTVMEGEGDSVETGKWATVMTLGYDPEQKDYIGTFIGSMMTHLWTYKGAVDATGKKLTLDANGPAFDGNGTADYQDSIEIVDQDHCIMRSQMLMADGTWQEFMTAHHRRK